MRQLSHIPVGRWLLTGILLLTSLTGATAQETAEALPDSVTTQAVDSLESLMADSLDLPIESLMATADTLQIDSALLAKKHRDWSTWKPNPQRALWLALVIPGGGQIYNRKYWKLPIVYGGFLGCVYALSWNNMMYKDYSQAYLDIMDDDPGTASYNKFLHLGRTVDSTNEERYKELFKKRKDKYRRWRDLSFFVMVGVYALSVIDTYVDAELSCFDISKDLSMKIEPTLLNSGPSGNPLQASALGLNCSIHF